MFISLLKTFLILIVGTLSGYLFQKWNNKNQLFAAEFLKKLAIFLQKLGMVWLTSITYVGSLWVFKIDSIIEIISLPFVGITSIITGGAFAFLLAKYLNYNRIDAGSIFSCGFFSNTVTLGGMICFFYLGEEGYALVPIYTFFVRLVYYGIGFPIARMHNINFYKEEESIANKLVEILKDPFLFIGVTAVIIGLLLNISPSIRPKIYGPINEILIPVSTFILLFSVGLNLKLSRISSYIKECLYISLIKFLAVPLITLIVSLLLGYQSIDKGLPLKICLIMSIMPVAFNSVIAANIYDLNVDMVNACWIFTTISIIFVLPFLFIFLNLF